MEQITRQQSYAMRGLAILAIVLHNYCHWLQMVAHENEYQFFAFRVRRMIMEFSSPSWDLPIMLLSFFGHYGVPVFVFLSAYGLVRKYEGKMQTDSSASSLKSVWTFIYRHYKKLFIMMITGYVSFVMIDIMRMGHSHYHFMDVIGQLGMFNNLYKNPDISIWPGPYWFFGLMVQIYVVYRLVLYTGPGSLTHYIASKFKDGDKVTETKVASFIMWVLLLVSLFVQLLFNPEGNNLMWYRYNIFGSLPVFITGLIFARWHGFKELPHVLYMMLAIASVAFTFMFSLHFVTWVLVPFVFCLGIFAFVKILPQMILNKLAWVGRISAAMFVCHPIVRILIIHISKCGDVFSGVILYLVITIVLAIFFQKLIEIVGSCK